MSTPDSPLFSSHGNQGSLITDDNGIMWGDYDDGITMTDGSHMSFGPYYPKAQSPSLQYSAHANQPAAPSYHGYDADLYSKSVPKVKGHMDRNSSALSRLSSLNSEDRAIVADIDRSAQPDIQKYKQLLKAKLRALRHQEKKVLQPDVGDLGYFDTDLESDLTVVSSDTDESSSTLSYSSSDSQNSLLIKRQEKSPPKLNQHPPVSRSPGHKALTTARDPDANPDHTLRTAALSDSVQKQQLDQWRQDALFCVFLYLDSYTLLRAGAVCREWRKISSHPALWRRVVLAGRPISSKVKKSLLL